MSRRRMLTCIVALPKRSMLLLGLADRRDARLFDLADELETNERALRTLFAGDGRDTDEIPEFEILVDRQRSLVERLCTTPARSSGGLVAKARCVRLRDPSTGYDDALRLGLSLAADVIGVFGDPS